jgi:PST family polysaccharide transporter
LAGIFISAFCYWSSEEIVILLFGVQWHNAVTCFKWLSISVWAQMISASAGAIYQSIGNTKLLFQSGLVCVIIFIAAVSCGILSGDLNYLALFVSISLILRFFIDCYFLIKFGFGKKLKDFLYCFIPDLILFALLFGGLWGVSLLISKIIFSLMLSAIYKFIFALVIYGLSLIITGQGKYIKMLLSLKR